jgi:polynucleotide 5'-hydroxyl-kinase GRC3/NOL9
MERGELLNLFLDKGCRKIMVIGGSDTGKTTLVLSLATELSRRGLKVGVIDCDLGQSTIGPPGVLGLQLPWNSPGEKELLFPTRMIFMGSITPSQDVGMVVQGSLKLEREAQNLGYDVLLIDTSGMIEGPLAALLKRSKIRQLLPDAILVLERSAETEHIFRSLESEYCRNTLRLLPPERVRRRTRQERAFYRLGKWRSFFEQSELYFLELSSVKLKALSRDLDPENPQLVDGHLLGLNDERGFTLSLGSFVGREDTLLYFKSPLRGDIREVREIAFGNLYFADSTE